MKNLRKFLFLAIALPFFAAACSGTNRYFVKKPDEIRARTKRVLFLPVYMDKAFFPVLTKDARAVDQEGYSPEFQKSITSAIAEKMPLIDQVAIDALQNSGFRFEVVTGNLAAGSVKPKLSPFLRKKDGNVDLAWPFNQVYELKPETLTKLAQQYQVDAVFFHFIQINKTWYHTSWSTPVYGGRLTTTICMPLDAVVYLPQLYAADGSLLYGGERFEPIHFQKAEHFDNRNGEMLVYLQKATKHPTQEGKIRRAREDLPYVMELLKKMDKQSLLERIGTQKGTSLHGLVTAEEKYPL